MLTPGTRIGGYAIVGSLGTGGMGQVYRATDTTLKRTIAIKLLSAAVSNTADRLARFQREAEVLGALNHPNIAAIYGFEKSSGISALVMELVEGPTLQDRLAQGALPLHEALPIARQIAEAVAAADDRAIIDRDLKPGNIKIRPDGVVKVLDFELAKAIDSSGSSENSRRNPQVSQSPTMSMHATVAGLILGTAA